MLRHSDFGEADRIVTLYTRQLGKVRALAKGVRRMASRKAGHLEPFNQVALQMARAREMPLITQAETVTAYGPLRENLELTGQASYVIELLDRFTYDEGTGNPVLFDLLSQTLGRLASQIEPWLAIRYYEMRLLDQLGYRPKLFECAHCGREIVQEDQFFSYAAGGVICPNSARTEPDLKAISEEVLRYLRHFQRSNFEEARRARPSAEVAQETEAIMQGYFTYLLERELKTPGFLRQIRS